MNRRHMLGLFLGLLLAENVVATNEYIYEFGHKEGGKEIYRKDGQISLFEWNSHIEISVPPNMEVTYVKVRVNALSPPKVDYDSETKTISIKYAILELPVSSYSIFAKGVRIGKGG